MRVVLDSNAWVDWLVFDDPGIGPLQAAVRAGGVQVLVDQPCLDELAAVLAYPEFDLDADRRPALLAELRKHAQWHDARTAPSSVILPRCTDPDDQKFIALAHAASADWLITRDKALIKLNRRMQRLGTCIGTPAQWAAASTVAA